MLKVIQTGIEGLLLLEPIVHADNRGYFFESFNLEKFVRQTNMKINFVQDNEAKSDKGTLRGLHFQKPPFAQSKLVRVVKGKVRDVVVDLRKDSKTYAQVYFAELSGDNKRQLFIPKGFAHGYSVLEDDTVFVYKCDAFYNAEAEGGIKFDDPVLNIDWGLGNTKKLVSKKDLALPFFDDLEYYFQHEK
jgi:dTDP-4-dehydrorhamnose 3,5-epimerase